MATFQERLLHALNVRGMTAADLSRLSGISEVALSQYKKGIYKASQRNLELLSSALRVSIPWLMGADVPMDSSVSLEDLAFELDLPPSLVSEIFLSNDQTSTQRINKIASILAKEKKPIPLDELSEQKRNLIDAVMQMDDQTVAALNLIADSIINKRSE